MKIVVYLAVFLTMFTSQTDGKGLDAINYLEQFGYLDDLGPGDTGHSESSTKSAIEEFQEFNGLRVTGRLDKRTIRKMKSPRCGLPDVIKPNQRPAGMRRGKSKRNDQPDQQQPVAFYAPGYKWQSPSVKYKVMGYTRQLGGVQQLDSFRNAFQKWANVVPLDFEKVDRGSADIEISFARGQHSDGPGNAFDGRGGTLAHAYFPGDSAIAGDTHFDDDEEWTVDTEEGTNLEIVAAHEFGHALGMGHSNMPKALMAPFYQGYDENYGLHADDINGIQSLYGRGRGSVSDGSRPATPQPTPRPRTTTAAAPPSGKYCGVKFDAMAEAQDGYTYAFRKDRVYKMDDSGIIRRQSPRTVIPGSPPGPGAAVYDKYRRQLFILKGTRYWRYSRLGQLDEGYPRSLPPDFQRPRAAFQWSDGGIYLFLRGDMYVRWAEGLTRASSRAPPRPVRDYFVGAPINIEAALQSRDGHYYFFKGQRYWKFNPWAQLQSGYPKSTRSAWLSCGAQTPR